jgi:phosphomannomutase
MVPFCVKYKGCAAGMMVTASHNPKADNGYKMYGSNGAQLCEPHDVAIAELILKNLQPWTDYAEAVKSIRQSQLCVDNLEEIKTAYFKEMAGSLRPHALVG